MCLRTEGFESRTAGQTIETKRYHRNCFKVLACRPFEQYPLAPKGTARSGTVTAKSNLPLAEDYVSSKERDSQFRAKRRARERTTRWRRSIRQACC